MYLGLMEIRLVENVQRHRFELYGDDELIGKLVYSERPGLRALIHTEVTPEHNGKGLAGKLVRFALEQAQKNDTAVLPFCEYVSAFIDRHDEFSNLVPQSMRAYFEPK